MLDPNEVHSNNPKLIINTDIPIDRMQAKSQEEQDFIDLTNEMGKQNVIALAMNIEPGRDFSGNPFNTAKDVITNLYANGGQESIFNVISTPSASPTMSNNPQDRIMTDY